MDISSLVELVDPPTRPAPTDWSSVEERLGTRLPADYKNLIDVYGQGAFHGDLAIIGPDRMLALSGQQQLADPLRTFATDGRYHHARLSPGVDAAVATGSATDQYLLWGGGIEGGAGFWRTTASTDPDQWPIVYSEEAAIDYDADGLLHYLVALYAGEFQSSVFPVGGSRYEGAAPFGPT